MAMKKLGKLEKVQLRDFWEKEAPDFTPWLAGQIHILGEALDMDLEVTGQEESVGPFSADIICIDTSADEEEKVLIENQLEKTDHKHLGQLITYASGLKAISIIWVAEKFTEEHRAALDWLNAITGNDFRFFGVEIELWRIANSDPAPQFKIISKPNEVARESNEKQKFRLRYWTDFNTFMDANGSPLRFPQPGPRSTTGVRTGKAGIFLRAVVSTKEIRAELRLKGKKAAIQFSILEGQKTEIEAKLGEPLIWHAPDQTHKRSIYLRNPVDYTDESTWPVQHA